MVLHSALRSRRVQNIVIRGKVRPDVISTSIAMAEGNVTLQQGVWPQMSRSTDFVTKVLRYTSICSIKICYRHISQRCRVRAYTYIPTNTYKQYVFTLRFVWYRNCLWYNVLRCCCVYVVWYIRVWCNTYFSFFKNEYQKRPTVSHNKFLSRPFNTKYVPYVILWIRITIRILQRHT